MGPVISDAAAEKLLEAQQMLIDRAGKFLLEMKSLEKSGRWGGIPDAGDY
jgi:hypothetical protein